MKKASKQTPVRAYRLPPDIVKRIRRQMRADKSKNETATVVSVLNKGLVK